MEENTRMVVRFRYGSQVSASWEERLLLEIRLTVEAFRFLDRLPMFDRSGTSICWLLCAMPESFMPLVAPFAMARLPRPTRPNPFGRGMRARHPRDATNFTCGCERRNEYGRARDASRFPAPATKRCRAPSCTSSVSLDTFDRIDSSDLRESLILVAMEVDVTGRIRGFGCIVSCMDSALIVDPSSSIVEELGTDASTDASTRDMDDPSSSRSSPSSRWSSPPRFDTNSSICPLGSSSVPTLFSPAPAPAAASAVLLPLLPGTALPLTAAPASLLALALGLGFHTYASPSTATAPWA
mmetsp:Transcript_2140/g.6877  ORF Transcript_2140/g.6877 Transcript_2140/m.6877 type:complete len:297 (-) Transcript_2140:990-1880(-)